MDPQKKHKVTISILYNVFNAFLLLIVFRGAFVIHGDGPGGFGELIIKGLMLWASIFLFIVGLVTTWLSYRKERHNIKLKIFVGTIATLLLMLVSGIMVIDACTDNKGYCRNWTIHFQ